MFIIRYVKGERKQPLQTLEINLEKNSNPIWDDIIFKSQHSTD